jgi:hypothetical protein
MAATGITGTYEERDDDWRIVRRLDIHPSGAFVFDAEWRGFEQSHVTGTWRQEGDSLILRGSGGMFSDSRGLPDGTRFERTLEVLDDGGTTILLGRNDAPEWSLLASRGPFRRVEAPGRQ